MARFIGIDITPTFVRAALVRSGYRTMTVERLLEVERARFETLEQALQTTVLPMFEHGEAIAIEVDGEEAFTQRIVLPVTAQKQLAEVIPFELEAHIPVDISTMVYDYRQLPRDPKSKEIELVAVAAERDQVHGLIQLVRRALGREPERVGCGSLPLANLANLSTELRRPEPIALVEIAETRTEAVVLVGGELRYARTLARGMVGLPDGAPALAAELRQTFAAWAARGNDPIASVWLGGIGGQDPYAPAYLSHTVGISVEPISAQGFAKLSPESEPMLPRFAKALGLAAGLKKPLDPDLRQGGLTYQRGAEFMKEKAPVLVGLVGSVLVSFLFATWAEFKALERERAVLDTTLAAVSRTILGEETTDPERATELLERGDGSSLADPMPHGDAFDLLVGMSEAVPMEISHDIEEFDLQRTKVRINGIVPTATDAQKVAADIGKVKCVQDVKIGKITQVVNSDRQKYVLDFELKCPEDEAKAKTKKGKDDKSEEAKEPTAGGDEK